MDVTVNITLSVDEKTLDRARDVARQQGTSVNALIRDYLERLGGARRGEDIVRDLERIWAEALGHSGRRRVRREELYEDRVGRTRLR